MSGNQQSGFVNVDDESKHLLAHQNEAIGISGPNYGISFAATKTKTISTAVTIGIVAIAAAVAAYMIWGRRR